jgi:biopolymer transport protein ExbD
MAMKLGAEGAHGKNTAFSESSEINVTPFVDVMLVLLIIFMVAAPLAAVNVKVDLPDSNANPEMRASSPVYISLQHGGSIYIGDNRFASIAAVGDRLDSEIPLGKREAARLYLRADADVPYKQVLELMNTLRNIGFYKLSLVGHEAVNK